MSNMLFNTSWTYTTEEKDVAYKVGQFFAAGVLIGSVWKLINADWAYMVNDDKTMQGGFPSFEAAQEALIAYLKSLTQ